MKIYVAGAYALRDRLRLAAEDLESDGHEITSSWLHGVHPISPGTVAAGLDHSQDYIDTSARADLENVRRADIFLLFTASAMRKLDRLVDDLLLHTGGRHVETGYAISLGKRIIAVGKPENIFHRAFAEMVPDFRTAREVLRPNPYTLRPI